MKQAHEFGLAGKGRILAAPFLGDTTVHALGLDVAQDVYWSSPFYWDRNTGTRAFAERLSALVPDRKPNKECAAAYSGALHYLKSVAALGVDRKQDGRAMVERMKAVPVAGPLFAPPTIRAPGPMWHPSPITVLSAISVFAFAISRSASCLPPSASNSRPCRPEATSCWMACALMTAPPSSSIHHGTLPVR